MLNSLSQMLLGLGSLPWDKAARFTLSIAVPLIVGFGTGQLRYGVVALVGSMYAAIIASVDADTKDRLLATLTAAVLITGCAGLGGLAANSPVLLGLGVLILGIAAGWIHDSHRAIEVICRFAVIGFLFGATQFSSFGTKLIEIDGRAALAFFVGGVWTILVVVTEHLLHRKQAAVDEFGLGQGLRRIWMRQTTGLRFGLCYGIVAAIAFSGSSLLGVQRPFWVAATALVVMRPDNRATVKRTMQRVGGTLIGVLIAGGIISAIHIPSLLIVCVILAAPFIPINLASNYTITCAAITVLVMVMLDLLTLSQGGDLVLLPVRFYATTIGCVLAAIGTAVAYSDLWQRKHP